MSIRAKLPANVEQFYTDLRALPLPGRQRRLPEIGWIETECSYGPSIISQQKYIKHLQFSGFNNQEITTYSHMTAINFASSTHNPVFLEDIQAAFRKDTATVLKTCRQMIVDHYQGGVSVDSIIFLPDGTGPTAVFQQAIQADYWFMPDELGSGTAKAAQVKGHYSQTIHLSHRDSAGSPQDYLQEVIDKYQQINRQKPKAKFAIQIGVPSKTGLIPQRLDQFLRQSTNWPNLFILIDAVQWRHFDQIKPEGNIAVAGSFSKFLSSAAFAGFIVLPEKLRTIQDQTDPALLFRLAEAQERIQAVFALESKQKQQISQELARFTITKLDQYLGGSIELDPSYQATPTIFCFRPRITGNITDPEMLKEIGRRYIGFMSSPYSTSSEMTDQLSFIPAAPVGGLWRFALSGQQIVKAATEKGMVEMKTVIDVFLKKHRHLDFHSLKHGF
ncbi:hypothetical protein ACFL18_00270 [Patescibacteria group bacterium]